MKFKKRGDREIHAQSFDVTKNFYVKAGQKINIYDEIQEAAEDADIYKTLEKYGTLKPLETDREGIYAEFKKNMDLRDLNEQAKAQEEQWRNLPLKVREIFKNDKLNFLQNAENWLADVKEKMSQKDKTNATKEETVEEKTNEQK